MKPLSMLLAIGLLTIATVSAGQRQPVRPPGASVAYRIEAAENVGRSLEARFLPAQLAILEKLNRADIPHLTHADRLVIPAVWLDELQYSPFPMTYPDAAGLPRSLILDQPSQAFGAYEYGVLKRWGPVSSGSESSPTPAGLFHLNWRSPGRYSTVNPRWFLKWYFNFDNAQGLSLHAYGLPGQPASHGCVRLLDRDAFWIYGWGEEWTLDGRGGIAAPGTPLLIIGGYAFTAPPPWQSLSFLARGVDLPRWSEQ